MHIFLEDAHCSPASTTEDGKILPHKDHEFDVFWHIYILGTDRNVNHHHWFSDKIRQIPEMGECGGPAFSSLGLFLETQLSKLKNRMVHMVRIVWKRYSLVLTQFLSL